MPHYFSFDHFYSYTAFNVKTTETVEETLKRITIHIVISDSISFGHEPVLLIVDEPMNHSFLLLSRGLEHRNR